MGASIRVVSQKFYSKLNNGNDFTTKETTDFSQHLKGGVLEEVKAVFNVQIDWNTKIGASTSSYYYDTNDTPTPDTDDTFIFRVDGKDFRKEGFAVGDIIRISDPQWRIDGTITSMSVGEIVVSIIDKTGDPVYNAWGFPDVDIWVTGLTDKTALKYDFGLIENDEPINFLSKLTNTEQTYLFKGIGLRSDPTDPTTRSTDFINGESAGNNKATYTGSARIKFVGLSVGVDPINTSDTTQEFQIEHIFKINPIYRDGELDSLKGIDVPPLDIYNGNLSLKYVFQTEFRTVINNPNTSMVSSYDTQLGSVGYLGESYNGYKNNYSVSDLVYTVNSLPVDRLEIGSITNVSFKINNDQGTFTNTTPVVVGHTSIVNSLYYSNSTDEYQTVWTDEDLRVVTGSTETGTLIKNAASTYVTASQLSISFDVEFTTEQELKLEDKQDYLLYYTVQDPNETIDTGDKVTDRIDVNYYFKNTDVAGLFDFEELQQYPHPLEYEEGVSEGFTNAKTFNESGMMADGRFWVLNTARLNSLKFDVAVYDLNNDTWNSLRSLNIDLSDQILVNGIQQIELDTTRGYILKDGDIFNYLKLTTDTLVGTKQYYNIQVGYRMPWQSWLEFKDAPTDFYDKSKSFNGLNQKSSNYSLDNANYGIKVLFDAVVDSTNYVKTSEEIKVYDYEEDDQNPTAWTCEIKTFDINETEIANNVIKDGYTQVRAFFKPLVPPTFTSSVNLQEAASDWSRFAHGNKITVGSSAERIGTWANTQANDDNDKFQAPSGPFVSKDTVSYASTAPPGSSITTTDNVFAVYGLYSDDKYEFYEIEGDMYSSETDNDNITYVIAFMTDDEGVEHTLSLCATTGGIGHELNPNYIEGDVSTSSIFRQGEPGYNEAYCKWDLVYDFGKSSCVNLGGISTGVSGKGWNGVGDLNFNVKRSGDLIEIVVSWLIDGTTYGTGQTIEYDLNTITEITFDNGDFAQGSFQALTTKFKGVHNIGFAFCSQAGGGFKNVSLTKPEDDFYSILRIEPKESQSDFSNYELSSIIDVPSNNLINKASEDSNVLEYDFINDVFVATGLIDTTKIEKGQQYDLSAEIRPRNLEE